MGKKSEIAKHTAFALSSFVVTVSFFVLIGSIVGMAVTASAASIIICVSAAGAFLGSLGILAVLRKIDSFSSEEKEKLLNKSHRADQISDKVDSKKETKLLSESPDADQISDKSGSEEETKLLSESPDADQISDKSDSEEEKKLLSESHHADKISEKSDSGSERSFNV